MRPHSSRSTLPRDPNDRWILGTGRSTGIDVHYFSSAKLKEIHAWVDQNDRVVLLDTDLPPGEPAAYTAALGEPAARLDYQFAGATLPRAEQVWLQKGAVVVVGAKLIRVGVFAPTTLADYEASLRRVEVSTDE